MHPSRILADIRTHRLSLEAQGALLQLCATAAHYDGALSTDALLDEIRPPLVRRKRATLLAELAPILDDYLGDVASQAAGYLDKSSKARAAARARWQPATASANAHASASAHAHANASADAHAEREEREERERTDHAAPPRGDARFDRFWAAYPKKTAKPAALKAWRKLRPDDGLLDAMLAALAWQRTTKQWKDDGIIPHPATWLNGRRWEDERTEHAERGAVPIVDWSAI